MYRFDADLGERIASALPDAFAMPVLLLLLYCCYFSFNARYCQSCVAVGRRVIVATHLVLVTAATPCKAGFQAGADQNVPFWMPKVKARIVWTIRAFIWRHYRAGPEKGAQIGCSGPNAGRPGLARGSAPAKCRRRNGEDAQPSRGACQTRRHPCKSTTAVDTIAAGGHPNLPAG